ncbi:MAG: ABC transporter substrate-binding protein, partial [Hyphomicrobiaceae bacterium]
FYAAQSYDTIMLIKSAVDAVNGDTTKIDEMRAAMKAAKFDSVRGKFTYGNNHMPIQNFYLRQVVADSEGKWTTQITKTVYTNHQDVYAKECSMK